MISILQFLETHGVMLAAGTTVILGLATLIIALHKQPIHRQRLAESAMVVCILFLVLACIPLPRFSLKSSPLPAKSASKYTLQPGDEIIAAEVFKFPQPKRSSTFDSNVPTAAPIKSIATPVPKMPINWPGLFSIAYVSGVFASTLYLLLGHILLRRLVLRSTRADPPLCDSLNLDARIRLFTSGHTDRPLSFGLFHPTILLPSHCLKNQTQLRHIVLHELAHISQRDSLGHLLFNLLFPILYFHPLYWWLRRLTNLSRELIADDLASRSSSRESYVADLLSLARDRVSHSAFSTQALGLFQSKTDFYRRMHMLVQTNQPLSRRCSSIWRAGCAAVLIILLMLTSGSLGVRRARAQAVGLNERKNAEERTVANERDAEVQKLRAEQAALQAELASLAAQRKALEAKLVETRDANQKAADAGAKTLEERMKERRMQAVAEDQADKARTEAKEKENYGRKIQQDMLAGRLKARENELDPSNRPQLDLVSLANNYVDAVGNVQLAELELDRMANIQRAPAFSKYEIDRQKLNVKIAQRKVNIFRGIAEAAIQSAKVDLESASRLVDQGLAPKSTVSEVQSRLRILEVILAQ